MSERPSQITDENVLEVDISLIAQDRRFPSLAFDNARKKLPKVQEWLREALELDAQGHLIQGDQNLLRDLKSQLKGLLENLLTFEIRTTTDTASSEHNRVENKIDSFFNNVYQQLPMRILPFLRQESIRSSQDEQALEELQKAAARGIKQSEDILAQLQKKLDDFNAREQKLQTTAGKVGAKVLGFHFGTETGQYQKRANKWFVVAIFGYITLLVFVIGFAWYYASQEGGGWAAVTWQEGAAKLVLFAALWYGVSFFVRNYNVNSHLAAVNRHRAAVARTLEDFLASNPPASSEMLQNGTDAMFKHAAIGFITKAEKDSGNPLLEIVNKIVNPKSE